MDADNNRVAVKSCYYEKTSTSSKSFCSVPPNILKEIACCAELEAHPNVIRMLAVQLHVDHADLVFELMECDLCAFLKKFKLSDLAVWSFTCQLMEGIKYIHSHSVMHRDLKPQNILLCEGGKILKIADFGLARFTHDSVKALSFDVVTLWYRAPELLLCESYNTQIDIWSAGCIVAEMSSSRYALLCLSSFVAVVIPFFSFFGRPLFTGKSVEEQLVRIFRIMGTPTKRSWPGVQLLKGYETLKKIPAFKGFMFCTVNCSAFFKQHL